MLKVCQFALKTSNDRMPLIGTVHTYIVQKKRCRVTGNSMSSSIVVRNISPVTISYKKKSKARPVPVHFVCFYDLNIYDFVEKASP